MAEEEDRNINNLGVSVLRKLPKFNERSSVKQFLKSVGKRSKLEKWSNDQKAMIVRYLCTDLTESYRYSNSKLEDCTYAELCSKLILRFWPKISKHEAYSELLSIKHSRQNISDYAGQIKSSTADLSDVITELQDQDARDELLMAGLNQSIKIITLVANEYDEYDDYAEIVRAAKRCEKTFSESRRCINSVDSWVDVRNVDLYN